MTRQTIPRPIEHCVTPGVDAGRAHLRQPPTPNPMPARVCIKPVESAEELRKAIDLMARAHSHADSSELRWFEANALRYPGYEREHTRIAVLRDEIVAALRMTTETIRIGEARLKMGGLGWIATASHHRRKGVSALLIRDTIAYMRQHNYHVAMLFGAPEFFQHVGFTTVLADYSVLVDTLEALTFDNPFKVAPGKPGDVPVLQKLHAANDADIACSLLRSGAHLRNKWARWEGWRMLKDDQGRAVAYLLAQPDGDHLGVYEAAVEETGLCAAVIRAAGDLADEHALSRIRFHVPPAHPLARFMLAFPCTHEMRIERNAGGMMACVGIGETLESMLPEWESRLSQSSAYDIRTELTLVVDGTPYRIRANRGALDVANASASGKIALRQSDLIQIITGYRHPGDWLEERRCIVSSPARALFTAIFAKRTPYVWRFDRF